MSTLLVNNIQAYSGDTVAISGSNIRVTGNTTLGDFLGTDITIINGDVSSSGTIRSQHNFVTGISETDSLIVGNNALGTGGMTVGYLGGGTPNWVIIGGGSASGQITASGDISSSAAMYCKDLVVKGKAKADSYSIVTSSAEALTEGLYTLTGAQIFSSSAWTSGYIMDGSLSASLFVFQKV